MMALAIKIISKTQLGAFFKHDQNVRTFHKHYEKVYIIKMMPFRLNLLPKRIPKVLLILYTHF